ncbi:MAG TPA: hypothetical protein VMJ10_26065, partial [Kofleriaceae bacterium]|nr:hypothetical protein [Kofleriaceae bacterium]
ARRRLAAVVLVSRVVSAVGALWLAHAGFDVRDAGSPARAWLVVLALVLVVEAAAWLVVRIRGSAAALAVATAAGSGALVAAIVVREAPRVALIEPPHALADHAGGALAFAAIAVAGIAAIGWIARVVASATRSDSR